MTLLNAFFWLPFFFLREVTAVWLLPLDSVAICYPTAKSGWSQWVKNGFCDLAFTFCPSAAGLHHQKQTLEGQLGQCSRSVVSKMKQGLNDMFRKVARKHIFRPYYLQSGVRSMRNPLEGFKWKNDMLWPSLKNISLADGGGWTEEKQNCNQGDQLKGYCKWEVTVGDGEKWIYLWYVFEIQLMGSRFSVPSGPWEWWSIGPATLILSRARS